MGREVYAFADAFDAADIDNSDVERIYQQHLPLIMLTDSLHMLNIVTRASHTTEKPLVIDVASAREACKRIAILNVRFLNSENNVAARLTMPRPCAALDAVLQRGEESSPVRQWTICSPAPTECSSAGGRRVCLHTLAGMCILALSRYSAKESQYI